MPLARVRSQNSLCLILLLVVVAELGCVGPMTPFGATSSLGPTPAVVPNVRPQTLTGQRARLHFLPEHQVLHDQSPFSIVIEDPDGVPDDFKLLVSYNGIDVTHAFLAQADTTVMDPLRQEVKLTARHLRLPAMADNRVKVVYWRGVRNTPVVAQYQPPVCSAFNSTHMVLTLPDFEPSLEVIHLINQHALAKKINPYFVAALVAQESSFNPQAISMNRAMGLTQMTPAGESEVIRRYSDWPRYPGLSEMPFPVLKLAVIEGQITANNEWRLNPSLSIQGGVEYLSYLSEYWSRPDKRAALERKLGPSETAVSEVLLASYNAGASRVADALERKGDHYLQDEQLSGANKYVHRVVSYCDHFEHQEDSYGP